MSNDPRINSALFNFCVAADDGPRNPDGTSVRYDPTEQASADDLKWLQEAMKNVEAPDRAVKRCVTTIMDWVLPIRDIVLSNAMMAAGTTNTTTSSQNNNQQQDAATPMLLLPAPSSNNNQDSNKKQEQQNQNQKPQQQQEQKQQSNKKFLTINELPKINDDVLDAIEELSDLCEDMNYAKEFMLMKGIPLFLGILRLTSNAAVNPKNFATSKKNKNDNEDDSKSNTDELMAKKQKQWSALRTSLTRCLAGACANFDAFQAEMTKFQFASVFLPLLSNIEHFCSLYPAELSAILLCITNAVRQFDPALQQFLMQEDGMFHLANCIEFLAKKNQEQQDAGDDEKNQQQHFIVAQRRAFSFARYLVEEQAVTSPRVVKAAVDLIISQSSFLLEKKKNNSTSKSSNEDDAGSSISDEERNIENINMTASFACRVVISALERTIISLKKNNKNEPKTLESMMPQWGNYVVQKFSTINCWYETFSKITAATNSESGGDDVSSLFIPHHDLNDGVSDLIGILSRVSTETSQSDKDVSNAFKIFVL